MSLELTLRDVALLLDVIDEQLEVGELACSGLLTGPLTPFTRRVRLRYSRGWFKVSGDPPHGTRKQTVEFRHSNWRSHCASFALRDSTFFGPLQHPVVGGNPPLAQPSFLSIASFAASPLSRLAVLPKHRSLLNALMPTVRVP